MRSLTILAALAAAALIASPAVQAQTSTTTTIQTDSASIWQKIKGSWSQTKGAIKEQWGKLTDDDLTQINGNRQQLEGKIQARYGYAKDQVKSEVDDWLNRS